jgi:hypothetical protein
MKQLITLFILSLSLSAIGQTDSTFDYNKMSEMRKGLHMLPNNLGITPLTYNQVKLESIKSMQSTGNILSGMGFAISAGSAIYYANTKDETIKSWLQPAIITGAAMFLSGVVITTTAGHKIKKLKKIDVGLVYRSGPGLSLSYRF